MSTIVRYEPLIDSTMNEFFKVLNERFIQPQKECPLDIWLQLFAFDTMYAHTSIFWSLITFAYTPTQRRDDVQPTPRFPQRGEGRWKHDPLYDNHVQLLCMCRNSSNHP